MSREGYDKLNDYVKELGSKFNIATEIKETGVHIGIFPPEGGMWCTKYILVINGMEFNVGCDYNDKPSDIQTNIKQAINDYYSIGDSMNFIIPLNFMGSHIAVSDTKEHCFVTALKYLQKDGFIIHGLKKTASGNSHDENFQDKYTVVGDGGAFADFFDKESKRETVLYVDSPIIERISTLSEEEMERWSKPFAAYSGEEENRYIYAVQGDKRYSFETRMTYIQTPDKSRNYDRLEWGLRNMIYTLKVINHVFGEGDK